MARIVMKFGGTSVAGLERIRNVARRVQKEVEDGNEVAVVVSAMSGETDRLVGFCREAAPLYDPAEYDAVVSSGEQVTSGLLAIVLKSMGVKARSWFGWQIPIHTTDAYANSRIESIDTERLIKAMSSKEVAVVAGFQGVSDEGRVTTLRLWPWLPLWMLTVATSIPMLTAFTQPTPALFLVPVVLTASLMKKCWNSLASVLKCFKRDLSAWQ